MFYEEMFDSGLENSVEECEPIYELDIASIMHMLESKRIAYFWCVITFGVRMCLSDMPTFLQERNLPFKQTSRGTIAYT